MKYVWVLMIGGMMTPAHGQSTNSTDVLPSNLIMTLPASNFTWNGAATSIKVGTSNPIVKIPLDGPVEIDWIGVNAALAAKDKDPSTLAILKALVAVRDGTWKELK